MKRFINHLLGLNNLRKFCGNAAVFGRFREKYRLKIIDKPKRGRVLVLAPHPDDDVFGCGGSLALHARQGDKIKVIYFAGTKLPQISKLKSQNYGGGSIDNRKNNQVYSSNNIGTVRSREALDAAEILKVSDVEFWGLRDNKFTADRKNVARLKKVIEEYQPKIIYCPSFSDVNPDHFEVARMLYSVIAPCLPAGRRSQQATKQSISGSQIKSGMTSECQIATPPAFFTKRAGWLAKTRILLYEVWTPIFINRLLKIDSVMKQKKAAISCHQSQLSDRSYFNAIIGLNQYRAGMFNAGKYAEGFWEMDSELYVELFEKYQLK